MDKKSVRLRRAKKTRARIKEQGVARLTVYKTPRHIYAQVYDSTGAHVVASASTVEEELKGSLKYTGNLDAAKAIGKAIAERAKAHGVTQVAFDRSGFKYHGRVKAVAESARENGLTI